MHNTVVSITYLPGRVLPTHKDIHTAAKDTDTVPVDRKLFGGSSEFEVGMETAAIDDVI
jgi:hypothetical protein